MDQTVACSSGGGQAPEGSRTLSGHFQRHAYRHQAISQRTLENIAGAWTAFETNHSPIRFEPAEVVKDGELLEADCWGVLASRAI